jgi:hypothetical protein
LGQKVNIAMLPISKMVGEGKGRSALALAFSNYFFLPSFCREIMKVIKMKERKRILSDN